MNSITRLILRRVASGNVKLTPRLLQVLKELDQDQPVADAPKGSANKSSALRCQSKREAPAKENRLTFISPLPGRWIRRTECAIGVALLLAAGLAQAASSSSIFETANNDFAQGKYAEAAHGYEIIIAQQGYSAPVLFNLANAQQRAGQLGKSILNYERAALLSPNDPDIVANLQTAHQKAGVELERSSPVQTAAHTLTPNTWFGLAAFASFLLTVTFLLKLLRPQARRVLNIGSVLTAVALAVVVGALGLRSADLRRAVVVAPEAVAGVSPVTLAQSVFKLRAGEIVTLQQTHGDFALVRNHAGQGGWVGADKIALITPPPALHKG